VSKQAQVMTNHMRLRFVAFALSHLLFKQTFRRYKRVVVPSSREVRLPG